MLARVVMWRKAFTPAPRRSQGFTLIEMLIVMTLIVVLASVGLIAYQSSVRRGREAVLKEDLFRMRDAIDQYYADKGKYPTDLNELVATNYIRRVPVDPITNSAETWQAVQAEPDPNNPTAESGINDVKSGSEAAAIDGTNYADW
jgi:general secretion pathway protein G